MIAAIMASEPDDAVEEGEHMNIGQSYDFGNAQNVGLDGEFLHISFIYNML